MKKTLLTVHLTVFMVALSFTFFTASFFKTSNLIFNFINNNTAIIALIFLVVTSILLIILKQEKGESLNDETKYKKIIQKQAKRFHIDFAKTIDMEKRAFINRFTAKIAHEINNSLMGIMSQVEYAQMKCEKNKKILDVLDGAYKDCERVAGIVSNLSHSTFQDSTKKTACQVKKTLNSLISDLPRFPFYYKGVSIDQGVLDRNLLIKASDEKFYTWFLKIFENSFEAMKDSTEKHLKISAQTLENQLEIAIEDSGHGLSPESLAKIFNPFASMKQKHRSNFNLAVIENEIKKVGGNISIESNGKNRTIVKLLFSLEASHEQNQNSSG